MAQDRAPYGKACPKPESPIKLTGKAYDNLQLEVMDRDNYHCVLCGESTDAPPHHIEHGTGNRSDVKENMVCVCLICHALYHHGKDLMVLVDHIVKFWSLKKMIQLILKGYIAEVYKL